MKLIPIGRMRNPMERSEGGLAPLSGQERSKMFPQARRRNPTLG